MCATKQFIVLRGTDLEIEKKKRNKMKMAPNNNGYLVNANGEPVSRTYQYRKVMKPMLERKRRARINRCLDELKEIMTSAFQTVRYVLTNYNFSQLSESHSIDYHRI